VLAESEVSTRPKQGNGQTPEPLPLTSLSSLRTSVFHLLLDIPSGYFQIGSSTEILYALHVSSIPTTCPDHRNRFFQQLGLLELRYKAPFVNHILVYLLYILIYKYTLRHAVAQLVKALCYKQEDHGFESR
jgi:hypothetical protein